MSHNSSKIVTNSLFCDQGPGISSEIKTSVGIGMSCEPSASPAPIPFSTSLTALWDTGAYCTVITENIARKYAFTPIGAKEIHGVTGKEISNVYLISLHLPNQVVIKEIEVMSCSCDIGCDVLIGMDIITLGDFVINNHQGRTTFTFRMPSIECVDFTQ